MRNLLLASSAFFLLFIAPARADRPLTEEERMKIQSVMTAQGCTGKKMEFDDGGYEVDDVRCGDDKIHDLKFDTGFSPVEKGLKR